MPHYTFGNIDTICMFEKSCGKSETCSLLHTSVVCTTFLPRTKFGKCKLATCSSEYGVH